MRKSKSRPASPGPFGTAFLSQLTVIEETAKERGATMQTVCETAGVGRSQPTRWRRKVPKTVAMVDDLIQAVEKLPKKK